MLSPFDTATNPQKQFKLMNCCLHCYIKYWKQWQKNPNNCWLTPFATRQSFLLKKDFTFSLEELNKIHWEHNTQSSSLVQVVCIYGDLGIHWTWFSCKKSIALLCNNVNALTQRRGIFRLFMCDNLSYLSWWIYVPGSEWSPWLDLLYRWFLPILLVLPYKLVAGCRIRISLKTVCIFLGPLLFN